MPRAINQLTDLKIRAATYQGKAFTLWDGGGLYLLTKESSRSWCFKYRFGGKDRNVGLGAYPTVSLSMAREARTEYQQLLAKGIDPVAHRQAKEREQVSQSENTFQALAEEWVKEVHRGKVSEDQADKDLGRFRNYVFPKIGATPISEVTPAAVLAMLRELEKREVIETAQRIKSLCSRVFAYAIATERATRNPAAELKGVLKTPEEKHLAAITDPDEVGGLLRAIDAFGGQPSTVNALKLCPLVFVRPGELRKAKWEDFDLEKGTWNYRPSKNGIPFISPLSHQAIAILKEQRAITGHGPYVFPCARSFHRPMSNGAIPMALARMGYGGKMTAHGFRAMARTLLAERLNEDERYIEMQLGHQVRDALGRAYNRTTYLEQRTLMMQRWADYLDSLKAGKSNVVALKRA